MVTDYRVVVQAANLRLYGRIKVLLNVGNETMNAVAACSMRHDGCNLFCSNFQENRLPYMSVYGVDVAFSGTKGDRITPKAKPIVFVTKCLTDELVEHLLRQWFKKVENNWCSNNRR